MTQRIPDCPWTADEVLDTLLTAQPFETFRVIRRQAVIVPADRSAHLHMIAVDSPRSVVCRRDAGRRPIRKPAKLAQSGCHRARARPRLALKLHQVQFADAALGPQIS